MYFFYKVENGQLSEGTGVVIPKGFTTYEPGKEPQELLDARKPSLQETLDLKLAEIMSKYSAAFAALEKVYPVQEREGWPAQEKEAKALRQDPKAETPVLSILVQLRARGETVQELAEKVLANAGIWRNVYAFLTGQQQRMYGEVVFLSEQENTTVEDIAAYPVEYQMPGT